MAKSGNLLQRVIQLIGRGFTKPLQIINKIRATKGGKNINTRYIKQNIDTYRAMQKSAERLGNIGPKTPIGRTLNVNSGAGSKTARVSFSFNYDFPSRTKSGRTGKQTVHMSVDLPASMSKSEMLDALKEHVKEWMLDHYQDEGDDGRKIRIKINSIQGV